MAACSPRAEPSSTTFHGLRSAVVFDPATLAWTITPDMDGGRWYPALVALVRAENGTRRPVRGLTFAAELSVHFLRLPAARPVSRDRVASRLPITGHR
jgi:hypothetical protein